MATLQPSEMQQIIVALNTIGEKLSGLTDRMDNMILDIKKIKEEMNEMNGNFAKQTADMKLIKDEIEQIHVHDAQIDRQIEGIFFKNEQQYKRISLLEEDARKYNVVIRGIQEERVDNLKQRVLKWLNDLDVSIVFTAADLVVPYAGTLMDGLSPGDLVIIHGFVPEDSERFQVDFQCGNSTKPRADVAFHFNPRFKRSGCLVCNTLQNERWGTEEITYEMPFEKTKPFEIVFMVRHDKFQVSVNKKHALLYKHKINLEKIDTLAISGKVKVTLVGFFSNKEDLPDSSQFVIPYSAKLNYSVEPGRTIVVKGEVKEKANSFAINLKPSESSDIALHLNPRIKDNVFVRNSYLFNSWGEEERSIAHFPFSPGMYFELILFCKDHQYNVAINGMHILEYKHRFKQLDKICILEVFGDVQLLDVKCW